MKSLILLFCVISCVTCISGGEADRYKKCLQDYAAKTGQLDAYCETKISQLKEGIDDSIKSILKRENMTECGMKLFKDNKVDDIALNVSIQKYSNSIIDEKAFVKEIKNIFEYIAGRAAIYCYPEVIGNYIDDNLIRGQLDARVSHVRVCVFKYLIDIKIIDPKRHNISEGIYANENCESEFVEWRENFPSASLSLMSFDDFRVIFRLSSAKLDECEHQKAKEEKLHEQMFSYLVLALFDKTDPQLQERRINFINLYKKFLENQLKCMKKVFECADE